MTSDDILKVIFSEETNKKDNDSWRKNLITDAKGNTLSKMENYLVFLRDYPKYKGKLKYDVFFNDEKLDGIHLDDVMVNEIYCDLCVELGITSNNMFQAALIKVLHENEYNPIQDYLNSLRGKWDGEKRIESIFIDLLQADNTNINKVMSRKWFIAAVKRAFNPGCVFDNMIVLQGNQGIGKTSICELLSKGYYSNISTAEIGNKDIVDKLNKTWIAVIDEMDKFNNKDMGEIKTFLSAKKDDVRLAYGRRTSEYVRKNIFIGSLNDETFLKDYTSESERRFWILKCNKTTRDSSIRNYLTDDIVNQIWAEAVESYFINPEQYLDIEPELQDEFTKAQQQFNVQNDDPVIGYVNEILNKKYYLNDSGEFESSVDFYNQFAEINKYDSSKLQYINKINRDGVIFVLKKFFGENRSVKYINKGLFDWEYTDLRYGGKKCRGWVRKNSIINENSADEDDILPF